MNRTAEEQRLGVGPLDAARQEASSTGVLVFLTICLLLSVLAMAVARGESLRAADLVRHTNDVKLTIAQARVALDEDRPERARELVEQLSNLTSDNPKQQARAKEILDRTTSPREIRVGLDVMAGEEEALLQVRDREAKSRRGVTQIALLFCTGFAVLFSGAAIFIVRRARRELGKQTAMLGSIVDSIGDAVVAVDPQGRTVIVNQSFRRMFGVGFGAGQISIDDAVHRGMRKEDGSVLDFEEGPFGCALRGEAIDNFDVSLNAEGPRVWLSATSRPVRNAQRKIESGVVVLRDVTQERNDRELLQLQAAELQFQSLSDELTGLYNRRGFMVLSEQYARTASRQKRPYGILFCDLNGLKQINDTHGHEAGDDAISRMADALKKTFREADIVARLGGDEYVALVDGADEKSVPQVIARLRQEMDLDAERHTTPYRLHTSCGVAFQTPNHEKSVEELLTLADERMYAEKKTSKESREARLKEAEAQAAEAREAALREAKLKEARSRVAQIKLPARPESKNLPPRPEQKKSTG